MNKDFDELLDSKIDAAEEQLEEKAEAVVDETVTTEKEAQPEEKEVEVKTDLDQEANADETEVPQDTVQETEQQVKAEAPIETPAFWSAEEKQAFAKCPKEVQQVLLRKETQRNEWANRIANEAERSKAVEKRVTEVFAPHALKLKASGINNPLDAVDRLLAWNEIFEQDPITGIADLMHKNGLTPQDFFEDAMQARSSGQQAGDPRIEQAIEAANKAKEETEQYLHSLKEREVLSEIDSFKTGKDSQGNPRKAFAEMYAPQISQAAETIKKDYPGMKLSEVLHYSYEYVLQEAQKTLGNARPPTQAKPADPIKAKIAASSVTGSPVKGGSARRSKAKSIDEAMDMAYEIHGM